MTTPTPRTDAAVHRDIHEREPETNGLSELYKEAQKLERELAAAQEARQRAENDHADERALHDLTLKRFDALMERAQRAEALAERYETRLFKLGAMDDAPCFKCGYNGAGYYQPHIHDCAAKHHAAREGK